MTIILRPYQRDLANAVHERWATGQRNVLMRLGTGGGKTAILGDLVNTHRGASCVMAHRQELVSQLSLTLARYGVRHDIIAAEPTRRAIARAHVDELGSCFYQPGARCGVASVDTLVRANGIESWMAQVSLVVPDEAHHIVKGNKWSTAIERFSHADRRMAMPTATPSRSDGRGLGSHADGYADCMVEGPHESWLMAEGWLTRYKVFCPPSDLVPAGKTGASGDWSPQQLKKAARQSHIVGDVPMNYLRFAYGQLGITFCTDVETAVDTCKAYRALGVAAEVLTGTTHDTVRRDILRRFKTGRILQLCVVDIVSEGFDLPNMQVGSFGRPSESLGLVMQQIGRLLRPMWAPGFDLETREGRLAAIAAGPKPYATLIDHVSHIVKPHIGPPDRWRDWSLDARDKKASSGADDAIKLRICAECIQPYDRIERCCPHCGHYPEPQGRSLPEQVDGDLFELDDAALEALRGNVVDVSNTSTASAAAEWSRHLPQYVVQANSKRHDAKIDAQVQLRSAMAVWGGTRRAAGLNDSQMQRSFYLTFGLDVLSAQALGTKDALALKERVDTFVNRV